MAHRTYVKIVQNAICSFDGDSNEPTFRVTSQRSKIEIFANKKFAHMKGGRRRQ